MKCSPFFVAAAMVASAWGQSEPDSLGNSLATTYSAWRTSIARKDVATWQRVTAPSRLVSLRNRILSEKKPFPDAVFDLPSLPPMLEGLKMIHLSQKGPTAKATWFGKIDFGIGGEPTENLMVVSFVKGTAGWQYDSADYVNLSAIPDVRKELSSGNFKYVKEGEDFQASGKPPVMPPSVAAAKYIAKVYVFCPGRQVDVTVNQVSQHHFAHTKDAEVVIGGARDGQNTISYTIKPMQGGTGKEAMTIRIYLMSEIAGTQPIKAFEYQVEEGGAVKPSGQGVFVVDPSIAVKLVGK
jgi:hypothetical protein